ncbi:protein BEAN1 [Arapaima gigas]
MVRALSNRRICPAGAEMTHQETGAHQHSAHEKTDLHHEPCGSCVEAYDTVALLHRQEDLNPSYWPSGWLTCGSRSDCGGGYMLTKLICSEVSSNQSSQAHDYPECREGSSEASLLVSPLVVAGIVIGLVLLLSCVTIIVGSLRKDGRLHNSQLRSSYAPDSYSYGGSIGELRSTCFEDFPPVFDFDSYVESLSQVNTLYLDAPPNYEDCVGPGATQIYIPTDDPPPYSLTDPCQGRELQETHVEPEAEELPGGASWVTGPLGPQGVRQQPVSSVVPEAAPPYEDVMGEGANQPIALIPLDLLKHTTTDSAPRQPLPHGVL